jgi:diadenosine tetraphosphate (Ap4A) HIT family hydrolase
MNATLRRFASPGSVVAEYEHWVVAIRPQQPTPLCCVLAARTDATGLGALTGPEAAELPRVVRDFEAAVRGVAPVAKFNYLALMMVDPNPHFHAVPRYAQPLELDGVVYRDADYPRPPQLAGVPDAALDLRQRWCALLSARWPK